MYGNSPYILIQFQNVRDVRISPINSEILGRLWFPCTFSKCSYTNQTLWIHMVNFIWTCRSSTYSEIKCNQRWWWNRWRCRRRHPLPCPIVSRSAISIQFRANQQTSDFRGSIWVLTPPGLEGGEERREIPRSIWRRRCFCNLHRSRRDSIALSPVARFSESNARLKNLSKFTEAAGVAESNPCSKPIPPQS